MRRGVSTDHQKQLFQYLGIGGYQGGEMRDGGKRWEVCRVWDLQGPDTANSIILTTLMYGSVSDPDRIRIQSGQWIWIRIQEGKMTLK